MKSSFHNYNTQNLKYLWNRREELNKMLQIFIISLLSLGVE